MPRDGAIGTRPPTLPESRVARALEGGDPVSVVAPAAAIDRAGLETGIRQLEEWGYRVRVAPAAYERSGYLAGSDRSRGESLRAAILDPDVRAIFFARGGYGSARILPLLGEDLATVEPKILVGYSDTTGLLNHFTHHFGWVTFHGPMISTDFSDMSASDGRLLREIIEGRTLPTYRLGTPLRAGIAEGTLTGGNLSTLASLLGTPWAIDARGAVLFVEDRNERSYRIDRLLTQLRLAGIFDGVRGVVFGEMPECGGMHEIRRVVGEVLGGLTFPVTFGLRSGHGRGKKTLPFGVRARLDAEQRFLQILDPVVR